MDTIANSVWRAARAAAASLIEQEPALRVFLLSRILGADNLGSAMADILCPKLASDVIPVDSLREVFYGALIEKDVQNSIADDLSAVIQRDPACRNIVHPFIYYKGFQALQAYRVSHHCWLNGKQDFALYLQSRISEVFAIDIHPACKIGTNVLIDHGTGIVIGETAVVGSSVTIFQNVTLGGTGRGAEDRHPKIGEGVFISAGATILGNVRIGQGAKIGAGSVVLHDVPPYATAVGIPARIIKKSMPVDSAAEVAC